MNERGRLDDAVTPVMRSDHGAASDRGNGAVTRTAPGRIFARMSAGMGQATALAKKAAEAASAATFGRTRGSHTGDVGADTNGSGGGVGRPRKRKSRDQAGLRACVAHMRRICHVPQHLAMCTQSKP